VDDEVEFEHDPSLVGRRVELEVGRHFAGVLDEPRDAADVPVPTTPQSPSTTVLARNTTTTEPGQSGSEPEPPATTTTVIGVVPVDSAAAAACTG
jgi:hypothetical protein